MELKLEAEETDHHGRLQLTTLSKGTIWLDQISVMPMDTYKVLLDYFEYAHSKMD